MTIVKCENCGNVWNYTGEKEPPAEISCSSCRYRRTAPEPGEHEVDPAEADV